MKIRRKVENDFREIKVVNEKRIILYENDKAYGNVSDSSDLDIDIDEFEYDEDGHAIFPF